MKIALRILLLAAIALLVYMCVNSILSSTTFTKEKEARELLIRDRLIAIRNVENGFRNMYGVYSDNFDSLQRFLNEDRIPFLIKEGELTTEQLKSGLTEKEAAEKGIIRRDTNWILAKDTLLPAGYNISALGKVPGFENFTFDLDTATIVSKAGYVIPVFEAGVPYDIYLSDLDKQLLINLKDEKKKLNRYPGLRVGSISEINNNAGNWEF